MNRMGMKLSSMLLSAVMLSAAAMPAHALEAADGNDIVPADAEMTLEEVAGTDSNIITPGDDVLHPVKTLTDNKDGTYTIKLEQYAKASTEMNSGPVDVVLILDVSASMVQRKFGDVLRFTAMKNSVFGFLDSMKQDNSEKAEDEQSRVSVVTFSEGDCNAVIKGLTPVNSSTLGSIKNKISAITCKGNTYTDEGIRLGRGVIEKDTEDRRKCVILFTDGRPCHGVGFSMLGANTAISEAQKIKAAGTELFAVVIDPYCTSLKPGELPEYEAAKEEEDGPVKYTCPYLFPVETGTQPAGTILITDDNMTLLTNRLMQLITSNYPDAADIHSPGNAAKVNNTMGTYYITADNSEMLDQEFQNIYYSISSDMELPDENAQIRDFIADDFVLDDSAPVETYTMDAVVSEDGSLSWAEKRSIEGLEIAAAEDLVSVKGFDYADNAVIMEGYPGDPENHGRKLVVEFKVKLKNKTFGGNGIASNKDSSGIYKDCSGDEVISRYPVPYTDIPVDYEISGRDLEIYAPDLGKTSDIPEYAHGYVPDGHNNAHVDISYILTNDNGETLGTLNIPAGTAAADVPWQMKAYEDIAVCGKYHISCTVTPVKEGAEKPVTRTKDTTAHVYYPEVCLKDTESIYGAEIDIQRGSISDLCKAASHVDNAGWACADGVRPEADKTPSLGINVKYPDGIADENGKSIIRTVSDIPLEIKIFRLQDGGFDNAAEVTSDTVFTHTCLRPDCPSVGGDNDNICRIHVARRVLNITSGSAEKTYNGKALTYKAASPWITSGTDEETKVLVNEALKDPALADSGVPLVYVSDFSTITNPGSVKNDFTVKGIYVAVNNAEGSRILKEVTEGYEITAQTGRLKVKAAPGNNNNNENNEEHEGGTGGNNDNAKPEVRPINTVKAITAAPVPEAVNTPSDKAPGSPATGDESKADIYIMLLFASGILLFVWVIVRKTKKLYENID